MRELVAASSGDPLAPFALRPEKKFVFSPDGRAAVGYKVRLGIAVASGDPIGPADAWRSAIDAFVAHAYTHGRHIAALGVSERALPHWQAHRLGHLAIGRDVVLNCAKFTTSGRHFRNLRQAVQRSRNMGVTVRIEREGDLRRGDIAAMRALMRNGRRNDSRGFSMILGRLFDGTQPDAVVAVARDRADRIVGAHRYLWAGAHDLSLDLPLRSPHAPNGVDERLVAEVVEWGLGQGVDRVSLAFAPFPDLFANRHELGSLGKLGYALAHLLDPLISVERLYRYLRKFHAFDQERYVVLRWRQVVRVAAALLLLEFGR